jgi:hypothetical protein
VTLGPARLPNLEAEQFQLSGLEESLMAARERLIAARAPDVRLWTGPRVTEISDDQQELDGDEAHPGPGAGQLTFGSDQQILPEPEPAARQLALLPDPPPWEADPEPHPEGATSSRLSKRRIKRRISPGQPSDPPGTEPDPAISSAERRLLPIALAYLPIVVLGAVLSFVYQVGAEPGGSPERDLVLRGTALAPPLFLPIALVAGAALALKQGGTGMAAKALVLGVGLAFLAGSTLNLPNDLMAAEAAGSPPTLTFALGVLHIILGVALITQAAAALRSHVKRLRT